MIEIKNFYCQDVALEDNSKDYKVIKVSTRTYLWLKNQISRLETITDGNENFKDWHNTAKLALELLREKEERAKAEWFTTKEGSK